MNDVLKVRTFFVFFAFTIFYLVIIINLYLIQVFHNDYYAQLAYNQHNITVTISPDRALILDRNKNPISLNKESLSAFILPHKIENIKELKVFLKKHFPNALSRFEHANNKFFMYIKRKLNKEEIDIITKSNLIDIKILKEPSRFYPFSFLGTILGITDIDNNGLFGIEKEFNKQLSGSPTTFILDKDARSGHFYFKRKISISGKDSNSITLTIDKDLQFLAYQELKEAIKKFQALEGGVIILNPQNGQIISMASLPDFDPNNTKKIDLELTKNKVITNAYEFGSVMKVFVAIAALEEGLVTQDELIDCENTKEVKIDGMKFTTWAPHGVLPFTEVIEKSNNVGMVKIAKKVGEKLYDHYLKFGFTSKINIQLGGEQKGFINTPKKWSKRSIISLAFGYEISATLLQLAKAFAIIANDGFDVMPTLILTNDANKQKKQLYSQATINMIKKILQNTVAKGTAKNAQINGYTVMGKTGTANIAIDGKYSKTKNMYTFVGIIEKNNYRRVIAVYIKESPQKDLFASTVAAPLFEKIAEKMLIHDKII